MMRLFLSLLAFIMVCRAKEIKVICYGGEGAGMDNVDIKNQIMCMGRGLVPDVTFKTHISRTLHPSDVEGYDVILGPGGYLYSQEPEFDADSVRAFVKAGGGYYGTCAGAFAGCAGRYTRDPYSNATVDVQGAGLSQASCRDFDHVGVADFTLTAHGQSVMGQPETVEIDHHNGPDMQCRGSTCEMVAQFANVRRGAGAVVLDKYGAGPVILISPHPEHPRDQNCKIVARATAFAGGAITREQFTADW